MARRGSNPDLRTLHLWLASLSRSAFKTYPLLHHLRSTMDHIPIPSDDHAHQALEVPYLENDAFTYDGLGFLSYPQRVSVNPDHLAVTEDLLIDISASFLQSWLWFGIVDEVGIARLTHSSKRFSFATSSSIKVLTDQRKYVTAKSPLWDQMSTMRWKELVDSPSSFAKPAKDRLITCIAVATSFTNTAIDTAFSFGVHSSGDQEKRVLPDLLLVLLSSQILCETLAEALIPSASLSEIPKKSSRIVDFLLHAAGWCPRYIDYLPTLIATRYYLSFFRRYSLSDCPEHEPCKDGCTCNTGITEREPATRPTTPLHTHPGCQCVLVSVTAPQNGDSNLTLFQFNNTKREPQGILERVTCGHLGGPDSVPFVAISHIRSLGLGNDVENALPHCQLSLLQSLANSILTDEPPWSDKFPAGSACNTPFWIDALCLPIDRAARKAMVPRLGPIFSAAAVVLVIDPTLYKHVVSTPEEALLRIRYSMWKQRLWTIEEGFFAQNLMFRFANTVLSLDKLLTAFREEKSAGRASCGWPVPVLKKSAILTGNVQIQEHMLDRVLGKYLADIHVVSRMRLPMDKIHLYEILRAGYLLARKFSYFTEDNEVHLAMDAWPVLLDIYGTEKDAGNPEAAVQRLHLVSDMVKRPSSGIFSGGRPII
ncbi:HET domain protein [Rhypophila decipiens]